MALEVSISNCFKDSCSTLKVIETTGAYDASLNPTGYGAPNPTLASVTEAILSITLPYETVAVDFDLTAIVTGATIIDNEFLLDNLTMVDFSSTGAFPDGIYDFSWVVTSAATDYTYTAKILNFCTVKCCIEKMRVKFQEALCGCNFEQVWKDYQGALRIFDAMKYNMSQYDYTNTIKHLKALQKICKIVNCSC
jgi:hypothetical protein